MRAVASFVLVALLVAPAAEAADSARAAGFAGPEPGVAAFAASAPATNALAIEVPGGGERLARADQEQREAASSPDPSQVFTVGRAQALFRSLTLPGWGQLALGRKTSGTIFMMVEAAIWTSVVSFRVQEELRLESSERTAKILAGIDVSERDEEFRRIVGSYLSSDEYNLYVVHRDAANLYFDDPVAYRQYIADNSLGGADAWNWSSVDDLLKYRAQRKDSQSAGVRANKALALAIVNRLVSALHAARSASLDAKSGDGDRSLRLEVVPFDPAHEGASRLGIRYNF